MQTKIDTHFLFLDKFANLIDKILFVGSYQVKVNLLPDKSMESSRGIWYGDCFL